MRPKTGLLLTYWVNLVPRCPTLSHRRVGQNCARGVVLANFGPNHEGCG